MRSPNPTQTCLVALVCEHVEGMTYPREPFRVVILFLGVEGDHCHPSKGIAEVLRLREPCLSLAADWTRVRCSMACINTCVRERRYLHEAGRARGCCKQFVMVPEMYSASESRPGQASAPSPLRKAACRSGSDALRISRERQQRGAWRLPWCAARHSLEKLAALCRIKLRCPRRQSPRSSLRTGKPPQRPARDTRSRKGVSVGRPARCCDRPKS
jgi:hypothetical protein